MNRIVRPVFEDCDLHRALMNTGYVVYREAYYAHGKYTGRVKDYYAPKVDPNWYPPGCVRDWAAEPRYTVGRGGNTYPSELVEMYPYTYGRF